MAYRTLAVVVLIALASGTAARAHHSYASTYDVSNQVRLEGRLLTFQLRNPHSYVHVQAPDESGEMQRWAVEWAGAGALGRQGIGRDSLRVGDEVVVTANPSRARGEYRALMLSLVRPSDGLSWGDDPDEIVD
jgi:hypothetical protein